MSQRARRRITSKFRLPSGRSYIGSHGYRLRAQGGDRDASEPEGVRDSAAGALPDRHARREGRAPGRGRHGHRPPPQGGDPLAPADAARADGAIPRGSAAPLRAGRGHGGGGLVAGHRAHRAASAPSLRPRPPRPPHPRRRADPGARGRQARPSRQSRHARPAARAGAADPAAARRLQLRRELDAALDRLWTLAAPDPRRPQGDTEIAAPAPESSPGDVSAIASVTLTYESTRLEG